MSKNKEFYIEINKDVCSLLERLSYDIETRKGIVTRLLEDSKNDSDSSVLDSIPFRTYHKQLEESICSFETAKLDLQDYLDKEVTANAGDSVSYLWNIEDFRNPKVKITVTN